MRRRLVPPGPMKDAGTIGGATAGATKAMGKASDVDLVKGRDADREDVDREDVDREDVDPVKVQDAGQVKGRAVGQGQVKGREIPSQQVRVEKLRS